VPHTYGAPIAPAAVCCQVSPAPSEPTAPLHRTTIVAVRGGSNRLRTPPEDIVPTCPVVDVPPDKAIEPPSPLLVLLAPLESTPPVARVEVDLLSPEHAASNIEERAIRIRQPSLR